MLALSLSEIRAMVTNASRGVGYSWGMAQEAGYAAKWLAKNGFDAAGIFARFLQMVDQHDISKLMPIEPAATRIKRDGNTCPLKLGCLLSDMPGALNGEETRAIAGLMEPEILLPFLSRLPQEDQTIHLKMNTGVYVLCGGCFTFKEQTSLDDSCEISISEASTAMLPNAAARPKTGPADWEILKHFAARTHLPESELSRERGAG